MEGEEKGCVLTSPLPPRNRLRGKPGLGSCTQKSEGETLGVLCHGAELFPIPAGAAPAYAAVFLSPFPTLPC